MTRDTNQDNTSALNIPRISRPIPRIFRPTRVIPPTPLPPRADPDRHSHCTSTIHGPLLLLLVVHIISDVAGAAAQLLAQILLVELVRQRGDAVPEAGVRHLGVLDLDGVIELGVAEVPDDLGLRSGQFGHTLHADRLAGGRLEWGSPPQPAPGTARSVASLWKTIERGVVRYRYTSA